LEVSGSNVRPELQAAFPQLCRGHNPSLLYHSLAILPFDRYCERLRHPEVSHNLPE